MTEKAILLVEDDADDELLTLRTLNKNHVVNRVVVARDGQEALDVLLGAAAEPERFVLVLLDLRLPKIDGLEVLRRIRADSRARCLPIVIFTSSERDQDLAECYGSGANSYVHKPVDFESFSAAVAKLGFYWILLNKSPREAADG